MSLRNAHCKEKYAFSFELECLLGMAERPDEWGVKTIQERSPYGLLYIFATQQLNLGNISKEQFNILVQLFERFIAAAGIKLIFYLRIDPKTSYRRIQQRGRPEETFINQEYATQICQLYDHLFLDRATTFNIPVVAVNARAPTHTLVRMLSQYAEAPLNATGGIPRLVLKGPPVCVGKRRRK